MYTLNNRYVYMHRIESCLAWVVCQTITPDVTYVCTWHDGFIRVTWLLYVWRIYIYTSQERHVHVCVKDLCTYISTQSLKTFYRVTHLPRHTFNRVTLQWRVSMWSVTHLPRHTSVASHIYLVTHLNASHSYPWYQCDPFKCVTQKTFYRVTHLPRHTLKCLQWRVSMWSI